MPLTAKGEEIMSAMKKQYGTEKGEEVFYASKNAGTITGVDSDELTMAERIEDACARFDAMCARMDAMQDRCDSRPRRADETYRGEPVVVRGGSAGVAGMVNAVARA